jgi:hypothetical protein
MAATQQPVEGRTEMSLLRKCARVTAIVGGAALLVLGAAPASAGPVGGGGQPGPREPVDTGLPTTFPAGVVCDFPITVSEVVNNEYSRTFPNGNTLTTGRIVLRVTNDETGESVVRNSSGPGLLTTGPNGEEVLIAHGPTLFPVFEGEDVTGRLGVGAFLFHGTIVFTGGQLTRVSGTFEDLCVTLAG